MQFWGRTFAILTLVSSPAGMSAAQAQQAGMGESLTVYECVADGMRQFVVVPIPGARCRVIPATGGQAPDVNTAVMGQGVATILPQCMDSGPGGAWVGPSARARECTRQYCARPEYREVVTAYAMSKPQHPDDAEIALTCISRAEADMRP